MRAIAIAGFITLFSLLSAQGQVISSRKPDGLAVSTGNVYFTSHDTAGAAVWRTSQTFRPGQESVLFWEAGAKFGDIVFAQIGGNFFGFFFALKNNVLTIRRVPLTGGNATVITTITNVDIENSHHNLVTDGVNLFWQDDRAIRKVSVNGGAITVLDQTSPNTPTAGIVLDNNRIIYASIDKIRFVPKTGAVTSPALRTIATASDTVTALHVGFSGVYWGDRSGAVRVKRAGAPILTLPVIDSGLQATSIATNGVMVANGVQSDAQVAWTRCNSQTCQLGQFPGSAVPIAKAAFGGHITAAGNVFWGDAAGIHRKPF